MFLAALLVFASCGKALKYGKGSESGKKAVEFYGGKGLVGGVSGVYPNTPFHWTLEAFVQLHYTGAYATITQVGNPPLLYRLGVSGGLLQIEYPSSCVSTAAMSFGYVIPIDQPLHVAVVSDGAILYLYVNGALQSSLGVVAMSGCSMTGIGFSFGSDTVGASPISGILGGVRMSSVMRYTSNYVVSSSLAYDSSTWLVHNFGDLSGTISGVPGNYIVIGAGADPALVPSPFRF